MAMIDKIREMKSQGYTDANIATTMQQQGFSPREISESLAQSRIKQAISGDAAQSYPENESEQGFQPGMEPSLMNQPIAQQQPIYPHQQTFNQQSPYPAQQEIQYENNPGYYPEQYTQQYPQEQYPDQYEGGYDQYGGDYGSYSGGISSETINEIAEQLISEKIEKTNKNINTLIEFKSLLTSKVEKMDERLKQIERIIDELQMTLIRKANEQEQNVSDIKTEMRAMQSSFGKVINPLIDQSREFSLHHTAQKRKKKNSKKKKR